MRRHALLICLLAAGCASAPAPIPDNKPENPAAATARRQAAPKPTYNLTGYPPAVRDGYIDGCESAKRSAYARKDAARMSSDSQYAMGWNDGYSICGRK